MSTLPRGLANKNPGNIRNNPAINYQGEVPSTDKAFKQFSEIFWGYRAIFKDLIFKVTHGIDTIEHIIYMYAPPTDHNDTEAYVKAVVKESGIDRKAKLTNDSKVLRKIVSAISFEENGVLADEKEIDKAITHL